MTLVFETKIKNLNRVYLKLLQDLADTKRYGADSQKELSSDFPDFWNVINASKRDLVRKDCEIVVAGEVSSGKTTLVNYLLGQNDLLEVKLLASTGCITRIRNSNEHYVEILDKNEKLLKSLTIDEFKSFQEKELKTLKEAYFVDAYLPVEFLKGHVILVDTPGIGETKQRDKMLLKFLPNAVAFIFVINARNAGGIADDRIGKILKEVSANTKDMPCFDRRDAIFLTNQWDSVEDALFLAKDKEKEVNETWEKIKSQIIEKGEIPSENIFQISLKEVYGGKQTKYTQEYARFHEQLKKTIEKNENKRVEFYLHYIQDFYGKAHEKNKVRLRQSKSSLDDFEKELENTDKKIESIKGLKEQVKKNIRECRKRTVEKLSKLLDDCLEGNKNAILNPEGEISMNDVSFQNIPKEVFRRIEKFVGKLFETTEVEQIMSQANETFRTETTKILEEINEIAGDLGVIGIAGINPFVNNVQWTLTMRNIILSMVGGAAFGFGAAALSTSIGFGLVSGGLIIVGMYFYRNQLGIETRSWLESESYNQAIKVVIAENIPENYIGKEFDNQISLFCDTQIPNEIKKLEKVQKETKSQIKEILSKRELYEHLDKIFNDIKNDLEALK